MNVREGTNAQLKKKKGFFSSLPQIVLQMNLLNILPVQNTFESWENIRKMNFHYRNLFEES